MALRIENLLDDIKAYRNDMVARNFPHQEITNLIMKWETKLVEDTPEHKLKMFEEREQKEKEALDEVARKAKEEKWPEYTPEELEKEKAMADWAESFKEKDKDA